MDIQKEFNMFFKMVQALEALIPLLSIADAAKNNVSHYLHLVGLLAQNGFAVLESELQKPEPGPAPVEDAKPEAPAVDLPDAE